MRRMVFNMRDERPIWAPPASLLDRLRAALPADWELIDVAAPVSGRGDGGGISDEAIAAIRGAEIYLGLGLPRELLLAGLELPARLRWIHTGAAGVRSLLQPELASSGVVLTNSAGIHAEPMAETVIAMMLHFARGIDYAMRAQQQSQWRTDMFESTDSGVRELDGATVGIIGYGGIGRAVARRARVFGMNVLATKRRPASASDVGNPSGVANMAAAARATAAVSAMDGVADIVAGPDALDRVLEQSDFLVITVPSTTETRGMIGAREIGRMRKGAVLINVARGDVIDENALIEALRERDARGPHLRGAGLDVFATEPLPPDSPLWQLPNVLVTPHVSATSPRFWEREGQLILDNIERYLDGRELRNVVDVAAGY